jgi:hypothetical protein
LHALGDFSLLWSEIEDEQLEGVGTVLAKLRTKYFVPFLISHFVLFSPFQPAQFSLFINLHECFLCHYVFMTQGQVVSLRLLLSSTFGRNQCKFSFRSLQQHVT